MTPIRQKIVPHLWFDKQAKEAADFYCRVFWGSGIEGRATLRDTPSGDCDVVAFTLAGQRFMAISAGPLFRFSPAVSFILNFDPSRDAHALHNLNAAWEQLSQGGKVMMPIDKYPFSERYGWTEDRYGLSWQLMLTNPAGDERPFITPSLLFVGEVAGKAEEAGGFYLSIFGNSQRGLTARYQKDMEPDQEGTLMYSDFMLENQWFAAMDSAHRHEFAFNEAISFMVYCDSQEEIDYFWEKLSAVPEAEQCGWLKDRFGLSWQVVPAVLEQMMFDQDHERLGRVVQALLKMKKFDLAALHRASGTVTTT
jgi:predicted 3-demethylubiquinone-9 3-methyltransferase (glyoxalase superfamily)